MDSYDENIIKILMTNGRISITELANRIGLSKSPCQVRLKRLQEDGYILGYRAQVNHSKLNKEQVAFVEVHLSDTREAALSAFDNVVKEVPEIEECHLIAGSFDYLLKVRTSDISEYRTVLAETISSLPNVSSSSTYVSLQSIKEK